VPAWSGAEATERLVFRAVGQSLTSNLPTRQRLLIGPALFHDPDLEAVHRELILGAKPPSWMSSYGGPPIRFTDHALSISPILHRCRAGDVSSCWVAIGVTGNAEPIEDIKLWYGDSLMESLIEGGADCASERLRSLCWDMFAEDRDRLRPLGLASRQSLVNVAIEMGGPGAFSRFATPVTEDDPRALIATTARNDADVVMAEWLRRVEAAKPDRAATDKEARFGAALWILLFAALATRSSRWRLG
jgi:hypothetical protein